MREIKFRAWDSELNEWCDADIRGWNSMFDLSQDSYKDGKRILKFENSNYPEIITMQYTGLKDKNGKYIYEGDIVKWGKDTELNERVAKVIFDKYGVQFDSVQNGMFYLSSFIYADTEKYLEVIGNIYENKELLEQK